MPCGHTRSVLTHDGMTLGLGHNCAHTNSASSNQLRCTPGTIALRIALSACTAVEAIFAARVTTFVALRFLLLRFKVGNTTFRFIAAPACTSACACKSMRWRQTQAPPWGRKHCFHCPALCMHQMQMQVHCDTKPPGLLLSPNTNLHPAANCLPSAPNSSSSSIRAPLSELWPTVPQWRLCHQCCSTAAPGSPP